MVTDTGAGLVRMRRVAATVGRPSGQCWVGQGIEGGIEEGTEVGHRVGSAEEGIGVAHN